jgi:shikimate kinase
MSESGPTLARADRARRCIALVGFRGSGKSVLGARLAAELRRPFFDLDREIELAQGRTIGALFRDDGEPAFRELEAETLAGVVARPGIVLAPGGGAILRPDSRALLRERSFCVYLDVAEAEILARLGDGGGRPRLTRLPFDDEVRTVSRQRRPLYLECADAVVEVAAGEAVDATFLRLRATIPCDDG